MDIHMRYTTDESLYKETEIFNFNSPQMNPEDLSNVLIEEMIKRNGVGLAANQMGIPLRAFAFGNPKERESCAVLFNPMIVNFGEDMIEAEEGCLSFPGLYMKIKRSNSIRVRYASHTGEVFTRNFTGMTSRIIQHEMMHLMGKSFFQYLSKMKLDIAVRKANKLLKKSGLNIDTGGIRSYNSSELMKCQKGII